MRDLPPFPPAPTPEGGASQHASDVGGTEERGIVVTLSGTRRGKEVEEKILVNAIPRVGELVHWTNAVGTIWRVRDVHHYVTVLGIKIEVLLN